jgi:tetratricopeptide (TPR) repeat protein
VYEKNATEFQSFFENIMESAFPDFRKIRPYGKKGDKGNDGYRPESGIYYQVYGPRDPSEKEAEAARKLKKDYEKLKTTWSEIAQIKTFYFVFNDKWEGTTIEIESALAELKAANPEIDFRLLLPKHLRDIFFTLKIESIQSLGFDIDSRNALRICTETLEKLEVYLDRGIGGFVLESLGYYRDIISALNDENLLMNWEIMECRALERVEKIEEAKGKYENLSTRYPTDPRPLLYLAEYYLNIEDYDKNGELLKKAESIDKNHWLLSLETLVRNQRLGNKIDIANIDEKNFPSNPRVKANFYRLHAISYLQENDYPRAETFLEKAIHLNPNRIENYLVKLSLLEWRMASKSGDYDAIKKSSEEALVEIDTILNQINVWGPLSPRIQAIINLAQIKAFYTLENPSEVERLAQESFELILQCYFNVPTDIFLSQLLMPVQLPQNEFNRLLIYLREAKKGPSDSLAKVLIFQFMLKGTLFTEGNSFFEFAKKENILAFISDLQDKKYDTIWDFMKDDLQFAVTLANSAKDFPDLRRTIIEKLPDDDNVPKEKLLLLLNYDQSNISEAFDILKALDLSKLRNFECKLVVDVARQKKAWDFVIVLVEKLLQREEDVRVALQLKLELFDANLKLDRLREAIEIGEKILSNREEVGLLDDLNKESLLAQTIIARLGRSEYPEALKLIDMYQEIPKTYEFKLGVEVQVYLKNQEAGKAIESIVAGIKMLKTPTPEQYAKLFVPFGEIGNLKKFPLESLVEFQSESFVKFKGQERWYFVGDGDELDAIKILPADERYAKFSGVKLGGKVVFEFKYRPSSEHTIENILPIEKYILWQCVHHFNQLATEGNLEAVEMIDVPKKGDSIDTANIIARFEDERKERGGFFDLYCRENVPLAFLAAAEGGLIGAIGTIQNEGRGFIRFNSADPAEFNMQKEVAKRILNGDPFYIDGTSALILSETGLLPELYVHIANLRVPQSVITMLIKCKERFRYAPGQAGHMQYVQGKLIISPASPDRGESLQKKFDDSVKLLESKPENIGVISAANKKDCFTEQKIPAELCDSCVLAQRNNTPVLTEDFLYLQANKLDTGKTAPHYCSALALLGVLYEQKKVTFEKYLRFFSYLSGYRFRFLFITSDDIEKAVLGDGMIAMVQPERIRWFNFPLTLSEAYGVTFRTAFGVVAVFLTRILKDDAILPDLAERIFAEILSSFPTKKDKRPLAKLFVTVCEREIKNLHGTIILGATVQRKIDRLSQLADIYTGGDGLWTP